MNMLPTSPATMSSDEIAEVCDARHNDVVETIERLFAKGVLRESRNTTRRVQPVGGGRPKDVFDLTKRDSLIVVSGYDDEIRAKLIDRWIELESAQPQIPTTAEAFAHAFTMLADAERRHAEQNIRLSLIDDRIDKVETAQTVLSARPGNSESIVHIRRRIGAHFGLSAAVVDAVMRQSPYAPKPAGMVRNEHADADGSTYAVFWKKDVTTTFQRFVAECQPVTTTLCTHPYITGRFHLLKGEAA